MKIFEIIKTIVFVSFLSLTDRVKYNEVNMFRTRSLTLRTLTKAVFVFIYSSQNTIIHFEQLQVSRNVHCYRDCSSKFELQMDHYQQLHCGTLRTRGSSPELHIFNHLGNLKLKQTFILLYKIFMFYQCWKSGFWFVFCRATLPFKKVTRMSNSR